MKTKNVTFSIPIELTQQLHNVIGKRGISQFVAKALKKALDEEIKSLRTAYKEAEKDSDRIKTIKEWELLDTEGWDESLSKKR